MPDTKASNAHQNAPHPSLGDPRIAATGAASEAECRAHKVLLGVGSDGNDVLAGAASEAERPTWKQAEANDGHTSTSGLGLDGGAYTCSPPSSD
eukprot:250790-Prorocentrum_minimum.AAC.5